MLAYYFAAASAPIHAFPEFFFLQYYGRYTFQDNTTIIKTMDSGERGMNPVAMTISILGKNIGQASDRTTDLPFSSSVRYRMSGSGSAAWPSTRPCSTPSQILAKPG